MGWKSLDAMATFLGLFLLVFLPLGQAKTENKTCPYRNQNLSPIEGWRSAEYCMQNKSDSCKKYILINTGWLNVTKEDGPSFCSGGCSDHTLAVLDCIKHVKRDYKFVNRANVQDLNDTIRNGCDPTQGMHKAR
ncbi:hypothetical protein CDL12_25121 [Handroanthus impetiginosus]|uniref:DUF7731 domain-containing protein n=1 Tax=Handroanthus impetiginosus TaxID=429701 RepID=A0A2G9GAN1_9LAMI|nr:hypothetical protein CDL12_25121 [Handroanthus impetiginosus]